MTTLAKAIEQMLAHGMPAFPDGGPVVGAGRIIRYGPKKRAWYVLHEHRTRAGSAVIVGSFGYWGKIDKTSIEVEWSGMAPEERARLEAQRREAEELEQARRADRAAAAANRARQQWKAAQQLGGSPYLQRKGVQAESALRFFEDGTLVVPMIRFDTTKLVGLQKIAPDGTKRFNKNAAIDGAACRLGAAPTDGEPFIVTEGVATALSIRMALDRRVPVFVAFHATNLAPIGRILRKLYPSSPIIMCADDDDYLWPRLNELLADEYGVREPIGPGHVEATLPGKAGPVKVRAVPEFDGDGVRSLAYAIEVGGLTFKGSMLNAGRTKAAQAVRELGNARVCWPTFKTARGLYEQLAGPVDKLTDFNDLHQAEGLEAVARQVSKAVTPKAAPAAPAAAGKGGASRSRIDWDIVDRLLDHYTLIRGTDTVYDGENRDILTVANLKLAEGSPSVSYWLAHDRRRTVLKERVVFDPTCCVDPETHINLFDPDEIRKPGACPADCARLLRLLQYLCGEADQDQAPITDWVLRWIAYPLQHVGAKMQTALVMAGPEGTGKNIFFGAVKAIYGRYGAIITQTEIESPYTAWRSRKLFIIANEIITRQEMKHQVGKLKNLVTEGELPIDEKYMPLRYEANHVNLCFFSNELQPLFVAKGDRRYLVIRTPEPMPESEYVDVVAEVDAGGADALHAYLLGLDLGGFAPWSKPPMTDAKENLIELGLSSVELFFREWKDGLLPYPYGPALADDVYAAYRKFCERVGERMPVKDNRFWPEILTLEPTSRKDRMRIVDPDESSAGGARQRRVFLVGAPGEGKDLAEWIKDNLLAFRNALGGGR